jgi:hypothetical protein
MKLNYRREWNVSGGRLDFRARSAGRNIVFFPSATNAVLENHLMRDFNARDISPNIH